MYTVEDLSYLLVGCMFAKYDIEYRSPPQAYSTDVVGIVTQCSQARSGLQILSTPTNSNCQTSPTL